MLPDRVSNPGPLTYESGALPIALRGQAGLLKTTEEVCGTTRPHHWRRETWWWNEHVGEVITAQRQAFKAWKTGNLGTRASYHSAKRTARRAVHHARQEADKEVYKNINSKSSEIYPITTDMVKKAISQLKAGKAPGPSAIVVEMIRALGDTGASMIRDLAVAIICDGKVPSDWEQFHCLSLQG